MRRERGLSESKTNARVPIVAQLKGKPRRHPIDSMSRASADFSSPVRTDTATTAATGGETVVIQLPRGVEKVILKPGTEPATRAPASTTEGVPPYSKVTVALKGRVAKEPNRDGIPPLLTDSSSMELFLGRGWHVPGLEIGIQSMKLQEHALITVPPSQAFGAYGTTSHCGIAPGSGMVYEVLLKSVSREIDLSAYGDRTLVKFVIMDGQGPSATEGAPGAAEEAAALRQHQQGGPSSICSTSPAFEAVVSFELSKVDDLSGKPNPFEKWEAALGGVDSEEWLDRLVGSMKVGEFSTAILGNERQYLIRLTKITFGKGVKELSTAADVLTQAENRMKDGETLFRHLAFFKARQKFLRAADLLLYSPKTIAKYPDARERSINALEAAATSMLRWGDMKAASDDSTRALQLCDVNEREFQSVKYRLLLLRARAWKQSVRYSEAVEDLRAAIRLAGEKPSAELLAELESAERSQAEHNAL